LKVSFQEGRPIDHGHQRFLRGERFAGRHTYSPDDTGQWTREQIKVVLCNPTYAGIYPFLALVSDEAWVRSAALLISEEGSEQFLVNLLFVLREVFGNINSRTEA